MSNIPFRALARNLRAITISAAAVATMTWPAFAQRNFTVVEHFGTALAPTTAPNSFGEPTDGTVKIDGEYCVPYSSTPTEFDPSGFKQATTGGHTSLTLTTPSNTAAHVACGVGATWYGAEWATGQGWNVGTDSAPNYPFGPAPTAYGYYEVRMKPTCVQGVATSFFWIEAPNYGPLELDIEFPNDPGHTFNDVHWTIHPSNQTIDYNLGFNPCQSAHRYGFLWTPGQIQFTVDGVAKYTMTDRSLISNATGFVMGNVLPGIPNWGGGPNGVPNQQPTSTQYLWWSFTAGATSVPSN